MASINGGLKSIDVERLNIVEKDGTVKMSLFNSENMPPLIFEGEDILPGHRQGENISGIMFYNGEGMECGGLIFGSQKQENGEYESGLSLTFDQYNQDQVVQISVIDVNGEQNYGLSVYDRPQESIKETIARMNKLEQTVTEEEREELIKAIDKDNHRRMFMGKNSDGDIAVVLNDSEGKARIRMVIDNEDNPKLEFLNSQGEIVYSLPPK